jgi:hypothetical protein
VRISKLSENNTQIKANGNSSTNPVLWLPFAFFISIENIRYPDLAPANFYFRFFIFRASIKALSARVLLGLISATL